MTTSYEDWMIARDMSPNTITLRLKIYRNRLSDWGSFDVPARTVVDWLRSYSSWTRSTYQQCLDSIYLWREETGQIRHDENPMRHIKRPPLPRRKPRPLTEDELTRALEAATGRTRAFLLLGYLAGLRAHEIAKFHGRDITADTIRVVGKGGVDATIPTHPLLWELAQQYPDDGYWFPGRRSSATGVVKPHITAQTVTIVVRQLFTGLGIEGASHRSRHTFATMLLRNGTNLRVVQDLMRHGSLATTAGYLGVTDDELASAVGRLSGGVPASIDSGRRRFTATDVEQVAPLLDVHMARLLDERGEDRTPRPELVRAIPETVARMVIAQHGRAPDDLAHLAAAAHAITWGTLGSELEPVECRVTTCAHRRRPALGYAATACEGCGRPLSRALGAVSHEDCPAWCEDHPIEDVDTLVHSRALVEGDAFSVSLQQGWVHDARSGAVSEQPPELVLSGTDTCAVPATSESLAAIMSAVTSARSLVV